MLAWLRLRQPNCWRRPRESRGRNYAQAESRASESRSRPADQNRRADAHRGEATDKEQEMMRGEAD